MYGDGCITALSKKLTRIAKHIWLKLFYDHTMPAGRAFRRKIEQEERADKTLKWYRHLAESAGDVTLVVTYKRCKALGLTKGAQ